MSLIVRTTGLEQYLEGGSGKIKVLVAGSPGAGKTRMSSFAPKPIYADCEGGLMSVADRNVPYGEIHSEEDMRAFLDLLEAECRKPESVRRFGTVVVDTLDKYQRTVIQNYLRKKRQAEMEGWEDWGYLDAVMNHLLARLFALPMHVIVLAHVKTNKDGDKVLDLQGAQRDKLPGDFDFVGLMENEFDVVDGKRGIRRFIRWEPTPDAEWLKARGGGLTSTEITFAETDWTSVRDGIRAQLDTIKAGEVIETIEMAPNTEGVYEAQPGGPVSAGVAKKAAPPAPKPATPPAAPPPPPAVQKPVPAPVAAPVSAEEAIQTVQEVLGGKVVEDTDAPATEPAATPVAEAPVGAPAPSGVPNDANEFTTTCGGPRYATSKPADGIGCGQPLTVSLSAGRVTGAEEGQVPDLIEIGGLRTQAFLHNACFAASRNKK